MDRQLIYLAVGKSVKDKIELLKTVVNKDSNDVFYDVITQKLHAMGFKHRFDLEFIESAFESVDIDKLKSEILTRSIANFKAQLAEKLGIDLRQIDDMLKPKA